MMRAASAKLPDKFTYALDERVTNFIGTRHEFETNKSRIL